MFVQRKHPITNTVEWVAVDDVASATQRHQIEPLLASSVGAVQDEERVMKTLMATSHYLDMLNDDYRNHCYRQAVQKIVKPGDRVLDIGTGSGLLALMAGRCLSHVGPTGGPSGSVVACEVFPPMASLAEQIIKQNAMEQCVQVVSCRSDDLPDTITPGERFDLVLTEIFDSELIGEGLLHTMHHALNHLAKDSARVIPSRATVYCQVVESSVMREWQDGSLKRGWMAGVRECDLSPLYPSDLTPLCKPVTMFEFNLANPPHYPRTTLLQMRMNENGTAHAVVMWWDLDCDPEGTVQLSTRPVWIHPCHQKQKWRQHWKQCWAPLPVTTVQSSSCITLRCEHDDLNISVGMDPTIVPQSALEASYKYYKNPVPPRRIWELKDIDRQSRMRTVVSQLLQKLLRGVSSSQTLQLVLLGERSVLAKVVAEELPADRSVHVLLVQETLAGLKEMSAQASLWETELVRFQCVSLSDVLNGSDAVQQLTRVHGLMSEPYFSSKEGQEPWMHYFMFRHCIEQMESYGLLCDDCQIYPSGSRIASPTGTRQPLEKVEGLDLSRLNSPLGAVGAGLEALPSFPASLWQCGGGFRRLTDSAVVLEESVSSQETSFGGSQELTLSVIQRGSCDAVVLWPEYGFHNSADALQYRGYEPVGAPHFAVHGVCLLPEAVECHPGDSRAPSYQGLRIRIRADPDTLEFVAESAIHEAALGQER